MRTIRELTPRERQVAEMVADGYQNGEIATKLGIATSTVTVHLQNVYRKAELRNRTDLAVWWTEHGEASA